MVKSSLVDFPEMISCVLFTPGCNYNCFFCHNRELISGPYESLSVIEAFAFLKKRQGLLDGVVITGGEPTLHPDLPDIIRRIRDMGFAVKLDSNGSSPEMIRRILDEDICSYFAIDYKAPAADYPKYCGPGADAGKALETIGLLLDANAAFEVRTTVFPQLDEDDLRIMCRELPLLPRYVLNRYKEPPIYLHEHESWVKSDALLNCDLQLLAQKLRTLQPNITV